MKKLIAVLLAVLMLLGLVACAAEKSGASEDYAPEAPGRTGLDYSYSGDSVSPPKEGAGQSGASEDLSAASGQKLIRKIRITAETDDYQAFLDSVTRKISELDGYIEDIEASTSGSYPYATLTVRVPANRLSELSDSVAGIGNVTYKHESQQDVTLQYVDTESHISALRTEQDRLMELLDQAGSLSEILEIEDRLAYVRYELESYERSLRALANQVEYATATIEVRQVKAFTPTEEVGFWENIRDGFLDSVNGLWELLKEVFSFLIISLPYLLVCLVLPLVILIIVLKRHSRKKKADGGGRRKTRKKGGDVGQEEAAQAPAEPE